MTGEQQSKCEFRIHAAASAAAAVGLVPIPGADIGPISAIQVAMILSLADIFEVPFTSELATQSAKTFMVGQLGKNLVGQAAKFIPFLGVGINATIAFGLTTALGWETAHEFERKAKTMQIE